jgi:hypothetical protein
LSGEARDQVTTKKPKTVDPNGGIDKQGELIRHQRRLPAAPSQLAGQILADQAEQLFATLDLLEQRGNRGACAQVVPNMVGGLSHTSSLGDLIAERNVVVDAPAPAGQTFTTCSE